MDHDFDEFITEADVKSYVKSKKFPSFPDELVESMFAEANSSADGLIDAEQLGKAVSGQFPHRAHNGDWYRLFELVITPALTSNDFLTALPPAPPPQQTIRANFEQEGEILTFSPQTSRPPPRADL